MLYGTVFDKKMEKLVPKIIWRIFAILFSRVENKAIK